MEPVEFTALDANGVPHRYTVILHSGTEGRAIVLRLLAAGIPALGPLLDGLLRAEPIVAAIQSGSLSQVIDGAWTDLLVHLKAAPVVDRLADMAILLAADDGALVDALFRHTLRDGKQLRDRVVFDEAYRANYVEMGRALWAVIGANRFFPVPATSSTPSGR